MALQKVGSWAFILGVVIAVIAGALMAVFFDTMAQYGDAIALVLVILGIIVGFLNIKDKHITDFLVAVIAVASVGIVAQNFLALNYGMLKPLGSVLFNIVADIAVFVAPAAVIVGIKQIWALAKEPANQ